MEQKERVNRRTFLKVAGGSGATLGLGFTPALSRARILGANDRIRLGFIGVGNRGSQLLSAVLENPDAEVVALSDVYRPYLDRNRSGVSPSLLSALGGRIPQMNEKLDSRVERYKDFRELLDQPEIDAVFIATPDHWHALQTVAACEAGKDVYVEKPLTVTIVEGRRMIEAAERHGRIVQVGLQRRSSPIFQDLARAVQGGAIGKVTLARTYRISNMCPRGIGRLADSTPPAELDWDMWLGPRALRPYRENILPYRFRWWKDYSSQVANWGVHYFDAIRWMMGEEAPSAVTAVGGRFAVDDDRTIPDTMEVTFELPSGALMVFGQYEASGGGALRSGEIELRGTRGNLYCDASGYEIQPTDVGQFGSPLPARPDTVGGGQDDDTPAHVRNFLDSVKSRQPVPCDLETGHRSNTFALLANIALETRSRVEWDARLERVTNLEEANNFLHYPYREPWTLG